jgi:hypothetical protein
VFAICDLQHHDVQHVFPILFYVVVRYRISSMSILYSGASQARGSMCALPFLAVINENTGGRLPCDTGVRSGNYEGTHWS